MKATSKELKFSDVYQPPFSRDENFTTYVFSANRVKTFNVLIENPEIVQTLLDILNGTSNEKVKADVVYNEGFLEIAGRKIFLIRGWGYLTGCCALNLTPEKAAQIQDEFARWIVKKLKGEGR